MADPEAPAIFPYGGFDSLLVAGELSRDGQTFFARRIVAFSPELRHRLADLNAWDLPPPRHALQGFGMDFE